MRHPQIDLTKKATENRIQKTALDFCEKMKMPVLKMLMELGYFPEEEAYNNLIYLVDSAHTLAKSKQKDEFDQAILNLKVVMLHLHSITYKSDELLELKIRTVKLMMTMSKENGWVEDAKRFKNLLDRLKKKQKKDAK